MLNVIRMNTAGDLLDLDDDLNSNVLLRFGDYLEIRTQLSDSCKDRRVFLDCRVYQNQYWLAVLVGRKLKLAKAMTHHCHLNFLKIK